MELKTIKDSIGLESTDDTYDVQIQAAINFFAVDTAMDETNRFYAIMCFLQNTVPELVAQVTSYRAGDISESLNIPKGSTFCEKYQTYVENSRRSKHTVGSGARSGNDPKGFETFSQ